MVAAVRSSQARYGKGRIDFARRLCCAGLVAIGGCTQGPPPMNDDAAGTIRLERIAGGLAAPVALEVPDDGTGRLFIADQIGQIRIISAEGQRLPTPFLDLSDRMIGLSSTYDERGLLGLAFHPDYATNGRFFVYYTAPKDADDPAGFNAQNRVTEFRVAPADGDRADPATERIILDMNAPQANHNGGQLAFGPDGYLYIGTGDGGGANDVGLGHAPGLGNGQDKSSLLAKVLRIDVDAQEPYGIPPDNPFVGDPAALPEVYAIGLRNPWRFSFDGGGDHRLFAADVGQNRFEEVNIIEAGGNYGWNVWEAGHCFDPAQNRTPPDDCPRTDADGRMFIDPIVDYAHAGGGQVNGIAAIGGYVYRGSAIPELHGQYVFGDYSTSFFSGNGLLWAAEEGDGGSWTLRRLRVSGTDDGRVGRFVLAFGRDAAGELYVLTSQRSGPAGSTGEVYRIAPAD